MDLPVTWYGFRYLERFRCLAAECPDDCCHGWDIPVDEASAERLRAAGREGRLPLDPVEERAEAPVGHRTWLRVVGEEHRCALLGADRLCGLQASLGEAALPAVCSLFPRVGGRVFEVAELGASLACPEVSRHALLTDDGSDVVELSSAHLPRPHLGATLDPAHPYAASFLDVRGALLQLCRAEPLPLAARLALMARIAHDTRPFYRHDLVDGQRLDDTIAGLLQGPALRAAVEDALGRPQDDRFAVGVALFTLNLAHLPDPTAAFSRLKASVLEGLGLAPRRGQPGDDARPAPAEVEQATAAWRQRRAALLPVDAARLDRLLARYVEHHWFVDWYTRSPSLWSHAYSLFVRVAVLRFLLVGHPALRWAPTPEARAAALDAAAVEAVYSFSRTLDHAPGLLPRVLGPLGDAGLHTLDHALHLVRL